MLSGVLIGVAGPGDLGQFTAFVHVSLGGEGGGLGALAIRALKSAISVIKILHQKCPPLGAGFFGLQQRIHLVAPKRTFVGAA